MENRERLMSRKDERLKMLLNRSVCVKERDRKEKEKVGELCRVAWPVMTSK